MTWVVSVTAGESSGGEARVYGSWRKQARAAEFASRLIDRGLDAQVCEVERPTIKQVSAYFGDLDEDGQFDV